MNHFLGLDGTLHRAAALVADTVVLGLLWLLFSIPIVTVGAANTALFYAASRRMANQETYLLRDFWQAFKAKFLRATIIWLVWLTLFSLALFNLYLLLFTDFIQNPGAFLVPLNVIILVQLLMLQLFLYPLAARFDMRVLTTFKSAFFFCNRHLATTFFCLLFWVGLLLLPYVLLAFFPLYLIAAGIFTMATARLIMPIFQKYRPEMDTL